MPISHVSSYADHVFYAFNFRYQIERRIFQELLDLKRMQIRAGRANEQVLVKRLSDDYSKSIANFVGLKKHNGPFTFKEYERYLYCESIILKKFSGGEAKFLKVNFFSVNAV